MRAFIALSIPDFVKEALFQGAQQAKGHLEGTGKLSWVDPKNYHLTLCFLGEVSDEAVGRIEFPLKHSVDEIPPFTIEFEKISFFPSPKKPHALVASIKPRNNLMRLQQKVVLVASSIWEKVNDPRPFLPHVTLARVKEAPVFPFKPLPLSLSFRAQELHLFESRPTLNGSTYFSLCQVCWGNQRLPQQT